MPGDENAKGDVMDAVIDFASLDITRSRTAFSEHCISLGLRMYPVTIPSIHMPSFDLTGSLTKTRSDLVPSIIENSKRYWASVVETSFIIIRNYFLLLQDLALAVKSPGHQLYGSGYRSEIESGLDTLTNQKELYKQVTDKYADELKGTQLSVDFAEFLQRESMYPDVTAGVSRTFAEKTDLKGDSSAPDFKTLFLRVFEEYRQFELNFARLHAHCTLSSVHGFLQSFYQIIPLQMNLDIDHTSTTFDVLPIEIYDKSLNTVAKRIPKMSAKLRSKMLEFINALKNAFEVKLEAPHFPDAIHEAIQLLSDIDKLKTENAAVTDGKGSTLNSYWGLIDSSLVLQIKALLQKYPIQNSPVLVLDRFLDGLRAFSLIDTALTRSILLDTSSKYFHSPSELRRIQAQFFPSLQPFASNPPELKNRLVLNQAIQEAKKHKLGIVPGLEKISAMIESVSHVRLSLSSLLFKLKQIILSESDTNLIQLDNANFDQVQSLFFDMSRLRNPFTLHLSLDTPTHGLYNLHGALEDIPLPFPEMAERFGLRKNIMDDLKTGNQLIPRELLIAAYSDIFFVSGQMELAVEKLFTVVTVGDPEKLRKLEDDENDEEEEENGGLKGNPVLQSNNSKKKKKKKKKF